MGAGRRISTVGAKGRGIGEVLASFGLSYGIAILLIAGLVYTAGIWNILANTRLLDPLIEGGIIRYHDDDVGIVDGIDRHRSYLLSQDPIDYRLVLLAALIYLAYWGFKATQFHGIARFVGLQGSAGRHARAWIYGDGLSRFIPHRFGEAATTVALEAQGEDPVKARQTFRVMEFLIIVFEIGLFWLFGLWVTSYPVWMTQSMWAFVILFAALFLARRTGLLDWGPDGFWKSQGRTFRALLHRPATFARLGFLSVFCMLLDDTTPFIIAMAFTGDEVTLGVPFLVIQSGVVAGYIAKRFPITPHGIGQWEWAFTLALSASGFGFPEAASVALLDSALRWGTGTLVFMVVTLGYGVETSFSKVLARYTGRTMAPDRPLPSRVGKPSIGSVTTGEAEVDLDGGPR